MKRELQKIIEEMREHCNAYEVDDRLVQDWVHRLSMIDRVNTGRSELTYEQRVPEGWQLGDVGQHEDSGLWTAGIDMPYFCDIEKEEKLWGNKIECHGATKEEAEALRAQVIGTAPADTEQPSEAERRKIKLKITSRRNLEPIPIEDEAEQEQTVQDREDAERWQYLVRVLSLAKLDRRKWEAVDEIFEAARIERWEKAVLDYEIDRIRQQGRGDDDSQA